MQPDFMPDGAPEMREGTGELRIFRGLYSSNSEVLRRRPPAVLHDLKLDALTFIERTQSSALNSRDVYEHIPTAACRLNKAVALLRVEPLHCARYHVPNLL
jgi:hypothetical protein